MNSKQMLYFRELKVLSKINETEACIKKSHKIKCKSILKGHFQGDFGGLFFIFSLDLF